MDVGGGATRRRCRGLRCVVASAPSRCRLPSRVARPVVPERNRSGSAPGERRAAKAWIGRL
jgi:hypothetical protein